MKKILILEDRKLVWFISIFMVMLQVYNVSLTSSVVNILFNYNINANKFLVFFIIMIIIFIAYILVIKRLILFVRTDNEKILLGILKISAIYYKDISKIDFGKEIEIYTKEKCNKVSILSFNNNEDKYRALLNDIQDKTELTFDINQAIKKIRASIYGKRKNNELNITGLLRITRIYLILSVFASGIYTLILSTSRNQQLVYPISLIANNIVFILGVLMLIFMESKHYFAPKMMQVYIWASLILIQLSNVISMGFYTDTTIFADYIIKAIGVLAILFLTMFINRYIRISENIGDIFTEESLFFNKKANYDVRTGIDRSRVFILKAIILVVFSIIISYLSINELIYYKNLDKNTYVSVDDVVDRKYEEYDVEYISQGQYYYFIEDRGSYSYSSLIIEISESNFVQANDWHEETQGIRKFYDSVSVEDGYESIYFTIWISEYDDDYIFFIKSNSFNDSIVVRDKNGKLDNENIFDDSYYLNVINRSELTGEYYLDISYNDEVILSVKESDFK